MPFQPKAEEPEWKMIYGLLLERAEFGDLITYGQLDEALGRPFIANRSPLYRARRELGDARHRWLDAVPGQGYRVIEAREHLAVAQKHKRRARRQMQMMVHVGTVTDLTALSPDELERWDQQQKINSVLAAVVTQHEQRLRGIEDILRKNGMM